MASLISLWLGPCLAALLLLPAPLAFGALSSEKYTWKNVAIGGGGLVSGLLFHPTQPGLLYARTDVGGAFRWDGVRNRWIPLNVALGRSDAELLGVASFAVDAQDPLRLYLACGSYLPEWAKPAAILWSADQGSTWQRVALPFRLGGNADGRTTGERLQVDPNLGSTLYLGTNQDGLWRSTDQALTWQRLNDFPAASVTFVLIDPRSGTAGQSSAVLYAGANNLKGPGLFRSVDGGATWSAVPGQPGALIAHHAALDSDGAIYLTYANGLGPNDTTKGAVWKFMPAEKHWTNISPLAPDEAKRDNFSYAGLAVDAKHPGTVMVSTLDRWTFGDEIFRSTDAGTTWKTVLAHSSWDHSPAPYTKTLKPHWIGQIALDPFDAGHALFITGYGTWATKQASAIDHGGTTPWIFAAQGLEETVIEQLISPPVGAPLLSALGDFSGFRHDDLNASPATGTHHPAYGSNPSIDFAEQAPLKMVRTHSGPARGALSSDGGVTWRDFASTPPPAKTNAPGMIAISADGRTLVWLPKGSAPFYSTDDGANWTPSSANLVSPSAADYRTIGPVADRVNPEKFYVYDTITGQVYVSTDGGRHFASAVKLTPGGGMLRTEPGSEGRVWLPTPDGLYFSSDSGRHFSPLTQVQEAYQVGFGRAAPGKDRPAIYLAGRSNDLEALFRSDDYGTTWVVISSPQQKFGYPKTIAGDPRVRGRVYLGTGGNGIWYGEPLQP